MAGAYSSAYSSAYSINRVIDDTALVAVPNVTGLVDSSCPINWSHPLNQGLVADYTILPNSGWRGGLTLRDLVRGGKNPHDGTLTAGNIAKPTWAGGIGRLGGYGTLTKSTATGAYVSCGAASVFDTTSGTRTVSIWIRPAGVSGFQTLVTKGTSSSWSTNNYTLGLNGTAVNWRWQTLGNVSGGTVAAGNWYHIVGVAGVSTNAIYINGVQVATISRTGNPFVVAGELRIGEDNGAGGDDFGGQFDAVQIWDRELSAQDVAALYAETKAGNPNRFNWTKATSLVLLGAGFNRHKLVTVNHNKCGAGLTNFPVVLKITSDSDIGSAIDANGYNFRITTADGQTILPYERKNFSLTGGRASCQLYFKAPILSGSTDTSFKVYYRDKTSIDGSDPTNVWDADFKAVYHLEESSGSTVLDSTANANNGTPANSPSSVAGVVGSGFSFNGTNQSVSLGNMQLTAGSFTIEALAKFSSLSGGNRFILAKDDFGTSGGRDYGLLYINGTDRFELQLFTATNSAHDIYANSLGSPSTGVDYYIAAKWNSSTTTGSIQVNNGAVDSVNIGGALQSPISGSADIGARKVSGTLQDFLPANYVDELRLSTITRSADWLAATYSNLLDYSNFITISGEQLDQTTSTRNISVVPAVPVVPGGWVAPACPINWSHPLNQGLVADYTIVPNNGWRGGRTLRNLVRGGKNPKLMGR
jgi:hypothetical protein